MRSVFTNLPASFIFLLCMQVHSQVDQEYDFESPMGLVSARDRQINFDWCATQAPLWRALLRREHPIALVADASAQCRSQCVDQLCLRTAWLYHYAFPGAHSSVVLHWEPVGFRCSIAKRREERGQILTISTRISGICKENAAKYGPLSDRCSRIILSPTGS
jgi:hypothetical protein